MKTIDLKKKSETELKKLLVEQRNTLHNFRFGIAGTNVRNIKEGRDVKRGIARILTELHAREITA